MDATARGTVERLGEPPQKGGGGREPIWVAYPALGLQINFAAASWSDPGASIRTAALFAPTAA